MKVYFHFNIDGFSNCYVVTNEKTMEALIIDPGKITKEILEQVESGPFNVTAVLITHSHKSHVRGLETLKKIYKPKVYAADFDIAGSEETLLNGDGIIYAAGLQIKHLALPGHSADSMAYKIGHIVFTGDTIFSDCIGRIDLKDSSKDQMIESLEKIKELDFETAFPGHYESATKQEIIKTIGFYI